MTIRLLLPLALLTGLAAPVAAQVAASAAEQPITPRHLTGTDLFNLEAASDPQLSPDGRRAV